MSHITTDLLGVYNTYFQKPYVINSDFLGYSKGDDPTVVDDFTKLGTRVKSTELEGFEGREVYLPVSFAVSKDLSIVIPCATIRITSKKTIIRTATSERQGTIKEQFQTGDYVFTIKGVLIGKDYKFPEDQIRTLKEIYESTESPDMYNALSEIFMLGQNRVAIESLEFPEQEGKHIRFRPFVMVCETDYIDTLTLN